MADPQTSTIRLTLPAIGGDQGAWAGLLNSNLTYTDEAINQQVSLNVTNNHTLVADGSSSDEARYAIYNFIGAPSGPVNAVLPTNVKLGWAINNTTGGNNVNLTTGSGTTLTIHPTSIWVLFFCDGTNVISPPISVKLASLEAATAPSTPNAGQFFIYMDSADSKLKAIGPSATVTTLAVP